MLLIREQTVTETIGELRWPIRASRTPLTTDNSALVLVDHQSPDDRRADYETGELKHNVVALAKAAKVLRIPTVVTTTARDSMWGRPSRTREAVEVHIIDRSSVNAWDDPKVAAAIEATGRKKLIFAASRSSCAPSGDHRARQGYDAYVAVDARDVQRDKRQAGLLRMQQAGVILSTTLR